MRRPAHIRVMGKRIAIHFVQPDDLKLKDHPEDKEPGIGRSDGRQQMIAVAEGLPLGQEQDTMLHETMHIVEEFMGLDMPEEFVEKMATGLLAVLKDNPSLVAYLRKKEK